VIGGGDWTNDRLVPDFVRAIRSGHTLVIRSPQAVRPWQHVRAGLGLSDARREAVPRRATICRSMNFGPPVSDSLPVRWIVDRMCASVSGATWRSDVSKQPHEAYTQMLDSSKARHELGWSLRWTLGTALERTMAWYLASGDAADLRALSLRQIDEYTKCAEALAGGS
jgi:CDP-glucose 4,6-dehydratase